MASHSPYKARALALLLAILFIGGGMVWFIFMVAQALSGI